jgi:hypothetical protein
MELTAKADKIHVIFEHETDKYVSSDEWGLHFWFWRKSNGYIQIWLFNGIVYDILKRDECRHMYE